jgi:hypothetical protein
LGTVISVHSIIHKSMCGHTTTKFSIQIRVLKCTRVHVLAVSKGKVNERKLGYYYDPYHRPDDIRNTTAIAKKLRHSVVIEERFEFAIRAARKVRILECAHCIVRLPLDFRHTAAIQPPYDRHSEQVPIHNHRYIHPFCYISAKSRVRPAH